MPIPVILSGGSGTRLWPLSRKNMPKQFLALTGKTSLFQQTVTRAIALADTSQPLIVCSEEHRFLVAEQLLQLGVHGATILLEPVPRNTAPAIALAAFQAYRSDPDQLLLVLPADHLIGDEPSFAGAVGKAIPLAMDDWLVTFGIPPTEASTGFGYIHHAQALADDCFRVDTFVEKPDHATAAAYLESGQYDWNSGMFLFKASRYLEELKYHEPDIYESVRQAWQTQTEDLDFVRIDQETFSKTPNISIDYAVMERTNRTAVVPVNCNWSDIGSWDALWQNSDRDERGNNLEGDIIAMDSNNCLARTSERRLLALLGVHDLVIVDTPDAILVADRTQVQEVKQLVNALKTAGRPEPISHRKVYRPWGSYDSIDSGERFQVKRITVKPGASLSLQKHHHRAEHWIVVSGTAEVTHNDEVYLVSENESTYLPLGAVHRLHNPGKILLELIEVQSGSYLGEDDIIRIDDIYGRA